MANNRDGRLIPGHAARAGTAGYSPFTPTGSGQAELQQMEYRLEVPSSETNTEYKVTWDLVTFETDGFTNIIISTVKMGTNVMGNGSDAYTGAYFVPPPQWCDIWDGGFVFTYVSNAHTSVVPKYNNSLVGAGPNWNVFGGGGCSEGWE